jgi:hypothetical protein
MRKINRLRIALKSGAFWGAFTRKQPVQTSDFIEMDHILDSPEFKAKCTILWDKYTDLKKKYLDGHIWVTKDSVRYRRCLALYEAYQRDLVRLFRKYPSW